MHGTFLFDFPGYPVLVGTLTPGPVTVGRLELLTIQLVKKRSDASFDNRWLSDTILDTTQAVLRQQFLHDKGMQSVLYAEKTEFNLYLEDLFK